MSKSEAHEFIEEFFKNLENKTSKDVKKIKKLAMRHKIPLGEKRKLFCKKCLNPHKNPSVRIKKNVLRINCEKCGHDSRWKIKTS